MALLTEETRRKYFKALGLGEYNKTNIKKFQRTAFKRAKDIDGVYGVDTDRALRHWYNVRFYTKDFKPEEFRCECGGRYCTGYPSYMKRVELANLQSIRDHYKRPMTVTCGLRCAPYNRSLAGSIQNSKHLTGYACDFYMKGVTDTLANRRNAIRWIKKLPNHGYTYGDGYNSNGVYIRAAYMGNALHTDTNKGKVVKQPTKADKIMIACKAQANWMKNYKYSWESNPTIAKSKKKGTCVTYVACVLQRLDYLKSGQYIWHDSKGKVTHANSKMSVMYPNRKIKSCRSILKPGDVIIAGSKNDVASGSHIFIFTGKWSDGDPIIWDNHSCERVKKGKSGSHTYDGNKQVIAVIRMKG